MTTPFEVLARTCRKYTVTDYAVRTCLGVLPHEKTTPQEVLFNVEVWVQDAPILVDSISATYDYRNILQAIRLVLDEGPYGLQETLLEKIARRILSDSTVRAIRLSSRKTEVLPGSKGIGVEIFRKNLP